jgi:hypothetical protein
MVKSVCSKQDGEWLRSFELRAFEYPFAEAKPSPFLQGEKGSV